VCSCALNSNYRTDIAKFRRVLQRKVMVPKPESMTRILIVEDDQQHRDSIEALLQHDGYHVDCARSEKEAVGKIEQNRPDLILISLEGTADQVIATSENIRLWGGLGNFTPVVIFSLKNIPDGAEQELAGNIYVTAPYNFNQLRALLMRVLRGTWRTH
jgi:two-component system response regulator RegX3